MEVLINAIHDHIIYKDYNGCWIRANFNAISLFGLDTQNYIGKTSTELGLDQQFINICNAAETEAWLLRDQTRAEARITSSKGKQITLDLTFTPVFHTDGSKKYILIAANDITEQKRIKDCNEYLTNYDQLTDLPKRKFFEEELAKALLIAQVLQQKVVVMLFDLDRFKLINDSLGVAIGDQLLKQFAERLRKCKKDHWLFARLGDDEFALFISNMSGFGAHQIAQEIMECTKAPFYFDKYELFITASIGISEFPQDGEDVHTLMQYADIALTRAKELGKNQFQYYVNKMDIAAFKSFSLKNDLHKALLLREFEVYYQPKIDLGTNQIIGAEALLRWNHPEWGMVSPSEFISIAEKTGLIHSIGDWVLHTVCEQIKSWQQADLSPVPVAVNISPKQFLQKNFISSFMEIFHAAGIELSLIEVEITETSVIENKELMMEAINQFREFGIKVALDDFGTGYSSLSYLNQFQIDSIKIDRSFIHGIGLDPQNEVIVKGIIQLVKNLNLNIIAEGVETEEQLLFLRDHQCHQIQGYLYSKPVPGNDFKQLLKQGKIDLPFQDETPFTNRENQRKYYRIHLTHPLSADMTIARYKGKDISLGNSEVLLEDIGLGGVRFISNIELAVIPDIILRFETEILGEVVAFLGRIVWKKDIDDEVYEYGLEFIIDERDRDDLAKVLNMFSTKIRHHSVLPDCRFVTMNIHQFFKKKNTKTSNA